VEVSPRDAVAVLNWLDHRAEGVAWDGCALDTWDIYDRVGFVEEAIYEAQGRPSLTDLGYQELGWITDEVPAPSWATYAWVWPTQAPAIVIDETHVWNRDQMELAKEAVKRCLK
jgi:hypothetical protein